MTFQGMLRIVMNDYRKQHETKMFSVVEELMKTRHELREVQKQLHDLKLSYKASSSDNCNSSAPTISLFVQYNGFFNQLCDLHQTMTVENLLVKLRRLTGIPSERRIRIRVLSEDGSRTVFFLHKELNRTLKSYNDRLKARMILSIEDDDDDNHQEKYLERATSTTSSEHTYSFDESDV